MSTEPDLAFPIVVATLLLLLLFGFAGVLLVVNNTRRTRHRAELAELKQQQDLMVMDAEREAMQHTLREMGRELHDNVGQLLAVAQLGVNTVLDEDGENARLAAARDALENGLAEVRRMGHDLNTDLWQQRTLADAISAEAERLERVSRVQVHLLVQGVSPTLPPDTSTVLFRVFQIIISNAIKHSGADRIDIALSTTPTQSLTVTDNGMGFDPERTTAHAGLVNIHKRCALIGFQAHCTTAPGGGCRWRILSLSEHAT